MSNTPTQAPKPEAVEPRELNHRLNNVVATMEASLLVLRESAGDEVLARAACAALGHQVSHLRELAADVRQTLCTACGERTH